MSDKSRRWLGSKNRTVFRRYECRSQGYARSPMYHRKAGFEQFARELLKSQSERRAFRRHNHRRKSRADSRARNGKTVRKKDEGSR